MPADMSLLLIKLDVAISSASMDSRSERTLRDLLEQMKERARDDEAAARQLKARPAIPHLDVAGQASPSVGTGRPRSGVCPTCGRPWP
jgi:hypothetical protein